MTRKTTTDTTNDPRLTAIARKVEQGQRLDFDDALALYQTTDILRLGQLAELATLRKVGTNVYYSINRHINYTNICRIGCNFCSFSHPADHAGGYCMSVTEVVAAAEKAYQNRATEIHIVGGVNPALPFDYYLDIVTGIARTCPGLHIKAFTAVEIVDLAQKADKTIEQTLAILQHAGLSSLPGGGAEILDEKYFARACPNKPGPVQWLNVHQTAHRMGLMSNATMLYGYIETITDRIAHLLKLRQLQDISLSFGAGHFQCFVPLHFVKPAPDTPAQPHATGNDRNGLDDLKTIAISRLVLDNFDHIKAFWPMLSVQLAQVALCFGANDLDGTVQEYRIVDTLDVDDPGQMSAEHIRNLITEAHRQPVQRDGLYRQIPQQS